MNHGEQALADMQQILAPMMLKHQQRLNELAIREATAKAERAELEVEWQRLLLIASRAEWDRLGLKIGGRES